MPLFLLLLHLVLVREPEQSTLVIHFKLAVFTFVVRVVGILDPELLITIIVPEVKSLNLLIHLPASLRSVVIRRRTNFLEG